MTSVCVTGLGAVTPLGNDPKHIFDRLMRGETGIISKTFHRLAKYFWRVLILTQNQNFPSPN